VGQPSTYMLTAASKMMRCQATWEQRLDQAALLM
jgi:hypothetical protein